VKRDELFQPGSYSSIADAILRRRDLTASAKLVWMALGKHVGVGRSEVWPSIARLSQLTGQARGTVLAAVKMLLGAGLVEVLRDPGRHNRYRLLQPQAGLFDKADRPKKRTGPKSVPVQDLNPTRPKLVPDPSKSCTRSTLRSTPRSKERAPSADTKASLDDLGRLLSLSFPSGNPPSGARSALIDRAAEAIRRGATWPLLAWAVVSTKSKASKPWERVAEAGEQAAALLSDARRCFARFAPPFVGRTLADLATYEPPGLERFEAEHPARRMAARIEAWREQATEWPESGKAVTG